MSKILTDKMVLRACRVFAPEIHSDNLFTIAPAMRAALLEILPDIGGALAMIVDDNVEVVGLRTGKRGLIERNEGNLVATAYADAIRAAANGE